MTHQRNEDFRDHSPWCGNPERLHPERIVRTYDRHPCDRRLHWRPTFSLDGDLAPRWIQAFRWGSSRSKEVIPWIDDYWNFTGNLIRHGEGSTRLRDSQDARLRCDHRSKAGQIPKRARTIPRVSFCILRYATTKASSRAARVSRRSRQLPIRVLGRSRDDGRILFRQFDAGVALLRLTKGTTRRRSQHLPAASSIRHDHSTFKPQSNPRPRAGVRGLRRSAKKFALIRTLVPLLYLYGI